MNDENNELGQSLPAPLSDNPVCAAILASIIQARTAKDLHRIAEKDIAPGKGMNEHERLQLWDAVAKKFSTLNAAALGGKSKPRWG